MSAVIGRYPHCHFRGRKLRHRKAFRPLGRRSHSLETARSEFEPGSQATGSGLSALSPAVPCAPRPARPCPFVLLSIHTRSAPQMPTGLAPSQALGRLGPRAAPQRGSGTLRSATDARPPLALPPSFNPASVVERRVPSRSLQREPTQTGGFEQHKGAAGPRGARHVTLPLLMCPPKAACSPPAGAGPLYSSAPPPK